MGKINTTFKGKELLKGIKGLARSQGSYGRMLQSLYDEYGTGDAIIKVLDEYIYQTQIIDLLDFIMEVEGQ